MSPEERELNRHDCILLPPPGNPLARYETIAEHKIDLAPLNILNNRRKYRLTELREIANNNGSDL
jgi:hypothetical protein